MSRLANGTDNQEIGRRLLAVRMGLGLSQPTFAASLGVSPRAYQNYERGEREIPAVVVRSLYLVHHVEPAWLLIGEGPEARELSHGPLDLELLEIVLEEVERRVRLLPRRPDVRRTATLVRVLYEHFAESEQPDAKFVERAVRLVA